MSMPEVIETQTGKTKSHYGFIGFVVIQTKISYARGAYPLGREEILDRRMG